MRSRDGSRGEDPESARGGKERPPEGPRHERAPDRPNRERIMPTPSEQPPSGEQMVLVLGDQVADLVVKRRGDDLVLCGLRMRVFNDVVPISPMPNASLTSARDRATVH